MKERNQEICDLYTKEGLSQLQLSKRFKITQVRVGQILNRAGIQKSDRPKMKNLYRTAFTAIMLREDVKIALKQIVKDEGHRSLSSFVSNLCEAELKRRGVEIKLALPMIGEDVRLPLED